MAQQPRNHAKAFSSSDEQALPTRTQIKYTTAPLFTSRGQQREPFTWAAANAERRRLRAVHAELKAEKEQDRVSLSAESSPTEEDLPELPRPNVRNTRQLERRSSSGEGLVNGATKQTAQGDGAQRPRSAGNQAFSTTRRLHRKMDSDSSVPGSRIPQIKTPIGVLRTGSNNSHPNTNTQQQGMSGFQQREPSSDLPGLSSDSETAESMLGSPSPAAKERKEAKYRAMGLPDYSDEELERMKNWRQRVKEGSNAYKKAKAEANKPPPVEDPNDPYVIRRRKLEESEARLARMAASTKPLFVKNTTYNRVMETARELERKTSGYSAKDAESSTRASQQAPGYLRQRPAWVEKILHPDDSADISEFSADFDDSVAADVDANTPLPSIEALANPTPRLSRSAAQTHHMSPEKSKLWDGDLDFTGHSIQISNSPQLRVRRLDNMRDQEITDLEARAVATNRLDEIRDRNSKERSVLPDALDETPKKNAEISGREKSADFETSVGNVLEDGGIQVPGTPAIIYDARTYRQKSPWREEVGSTQPKEDMRDVLRALSRSMSRSPSDRQKMDSKGPEGDFVKVERDEKTLDQIGINKDVEAPTASKLPSAESALKPSETGLIPRDSDSHSRSSSHPRSEADPEERIAAEAKLFELQDNKSERNSIRAPSLPSSDDEKSDDEKFDETPKPKKQDPLSMPTPRVMGAFIETPAPTIRQARESRPMRLHHENGQDAVDSAFASINSNTETNRADELPGNKSTSRVAPSQKESTNAQRPPLVNTAKPLRVSDDIRRLKAEAQIDDSTIDSVDGFVGVPLGKTSQSDTKDGILEHPDLDFDEKGRPLSKKERERRLEQIALDRISHNLKTTSSSIRDARHGIERLEQQVSNSLAVPVAHKDADETIYIKVPVPRLWTKNSPRKGGDQRWYTRNWKFTWFGAILFAVMSWYIAETTACEIYCHPEYSSRNTWQPSDPFFPWAIPTKLDQWTGQWASTGASTVLEFVDELIGPQKGRRRWWSPGPTPTMNAHNWWMGRDGPRGIRESGTEAANSIFGDEVI